MSVLEWLPFVLLTLMAVGASAAVRRLTPKERGLRIASVARIAGVALIVIVATANQF